MATKRYTEQQIANAVTDSFSVMEVMRKLGIRMAGGSHSHISRRIRDLGLDTSHFTGQRGNLGKTSCSRKTADEILVMLPEGSPRPKAKPLVRSMREKGVPYKCSTCGIMDWCGRVIVLEVDHVNGNWLDNCIENLRFMCPNCHSQTDTYGRKSTHS